MHFECTQIFIFCYCYYSQQFLPMYLRSLRPKKIQELDHCQIFAFVRVYHLKENHKINESDSLIMMGSKMEQHLFMQEQGIAFSFINNTQHYIKTVQNGDGVEMFVSMFSKSIQILSITYFSTYNPSDLPNRSIPNLEAIITDLASSPNI